MIERDYTLELSDGTVMPLAAAGHASYPDVKAFYLPSAAMHPFSCTNLPARRAEDKYESSRRHTKK